VGSLDGKVAIVTGAGRGLGRSEALLLASEGAKVVVNDLGGEWDGSGADSRAASQVVDEIKAAGGEAVANFDSVSDWDSAQKLIAQAVDTYGDLNILVNNAGILRDKMSFNMTEEDWDACVTVHLKGHFAPTRFAAAYWREQSKSGKPVYGRIINTSSEAGLYGNAGQANYSAAKAGIAAMAIVFARELGRYGVTSNAIAPRARTRMTEGTFGNLGGGDDGFDAWAPENVAPLVAWLAGEEAADVNGQCFVVFGGKVLLTQGWHTVASLEKDQAWTVEELSKAKSELFANHSSDVPAFPVAL
jgi:NAD(P)-dependent dehydrogenase (short-subunit alcohol dehydrogenase family)